VRAGDVGRLGARLRASHEDRIIETGHIMRKQNWIKSEKRRNLAVSAFALVTFATAVLSSPGVLAGEEEQQHWVGTWSTALHEPSPGPPGLTNSGFNNQTLRQIVRTSVGGDRVRVRLSTFGGSALDIGAARIALRADGAAIVPESDRTLTFGGHASVTIPAGAVVISDPVSLRVPADADLAVSLFVPEATGPAAWHFVALQTSYISPEGDFTDSVVLPVASTTQGWFWLAGVEVMGSKQTGTIVAFGDSVTDGTRSTPDSNNRWPDHLARRLLALADSHGMGVLNEAISGNRLLHNGIGPNGLARFDRDVLTQSGVTHLIVLLGNNDILLGELVFPSEVVTPDEIIHGHRQLIRRARARGLTVYGATLTPLQGIAPDFVFPIIEAKRQAVNAWIRTSDEYDAVIDFDEVLRDPSFPTRLREEFDSGDHLHPNDTGYEAMANAIDLKLFKNGERR
jgi:lysophospholipase L1-like esterase